MITPTIFYRHMKDFVSKDKIKEAMRYIHFDKHQAVATTGHTICVVKDWPSPEEHFELPDGTCKETSGTFPAIDRILDMSHKTKLVMVIDDSNTCSFDHLIKTFKYFMSLMQRSSRPACCLRMEKGKLQAYCVARGSDMKVRIELANQIPDVEDFEFCINTEYLVKAISYIKDTGVQAFTCSICGGVMFFDTPDLTIVTAGARIAPDTDLMQFVRSDHETKGDSTEDLDFLA